jgi:hypothetical protein
MVSSNIIYISQWDVQNKGYTIKVFYLPTDAQ